MCYAGVDIGGREGEEDQGGLREWMREDGCGKRREGRTIKGRRGKEGRGRSRGGEEVDGKI